MASSGVPPPNATRPPPPPPPPRGGRGGILVWLGLGAVAAGTPLYPCSPLSNPLPIPSNSLSSACYKLSRHYFLQ